MQVREPNRPVTLRYDALFPGLRRALNLAIQSESPCSIGLGRAMERKSEAVVEPSPILSLVRGTTWRALRKQPSVGQLPTLGLRCNNRNQRPGTAFRFLQQLKYRCEHRQGQQEENESALLVETPRQKVRIYVNAQEGQRDDSYSVL